jgi:hypothetical protein
VFSFTPFKRSMLKSGVFRISKEKPMLFLAANRGRAIKLNRNPLLLFV